MTHEFFYFSQWNAICLVFFDGLAYKSRSWWQISSQSEVSRFSTNWSHQTFWCGCLPTQSLTSNFMSFMARYITDTAIISGSHFRQILVQKLVKKLVVVLDHNSSPGRSFSPVVDEGPRHLNNFFNFALVSFETFAVLDQMIVRMVHLKIKMDCLESELASRNLISLHQLQIQIQCITCNRTFSRAMSSSFGSTPNVSNILLFVSCIVVRRISLHFLGVSSHLPARKRQHVDNGWNDTRFQIYSQ